MTYSEWIMLPPHKKKEIADQWGISIDGAEEYIRQMERQDDDHDEGTDYYGDYILLDEDTQDRIADREGFTDRHEYSDYLWAMDKED